jgi:hypothetical protein
VGKDPEEKEARKIFFKGNEARKKLRRGNARRKFRWIIVMEGSTTHKLDIAVDGSTGYCDRTILHGVIP